MPNIRIIQVYSGRWCMFLPVNGRAVAWRPSVYASAHFFCLQEDPWDVNTLLSDTPSRLAQRDYCPQPGYNFHCVLCVNKWLLVANISPDD